MASRPPPTQRRVYTFEIGDRVMWSSAQLEASPQHKQIEALYGPGPFMVLATFPVPPSKRTTVGHHQWVHVSGLSPTQNFSGAWFVPMLERKE